jgi:starch synthase
MRNRVGRTPDGPAHERNTAARCNLLFVTSEIADFLKVGGLGEVSAGLPRALRRVADARVLLPGYRAVLAANPGMKIVATLPGLAEIPPCEIGEILTPDGLTIHIVVAGDLFDRPGNAYLDDHANPWGDNDVRFARLAMAAVELARGVPALGWKPDVLHLNDWPGALAAGYLQWQRVDTPSILTIHNLAYQGLYERERLGRLAIPGEAFAMDGVEFHGKISFLKAGIYYASQITTVSATYAREITTPEFGCGLDGLLRMRSDEGKLTGILNGIDESWDPSADPHLPHPFDSVNWRGKEANAQFLRNAFGLAVSRGPLFAVVSRLVHQKGLDLTIAAIESIVRDGGQLVVTGEGEPEVEDALRATAARHPQSIAVKSAMKSRPRGGSSPAAISCSCRRALNLAGSARCMPSGSAHCRSRITPAGSAIRSRTAPLDSCSAVRRPKRSPGRFTAPSRCSTARTNSRPCAAAPWPGPPAGARRHVRTWRSTAARSRRVFAPPHNGIRAERSKPAGR